MSALVINHKSLQLQSLLGMQSSEGTGALWCSLKKPMALPEGLQLFYFSLAKLISAEFSLRGGGYMFVNNYAKIVTCLSLDLTTTWARNNVDAVDEWSISFCLSWKLRITVWCWKSFHLQGEGEGTMVCLCSLSRTMLVSGRGECIWDFVNTYCSEVNINRNTHPTLSAKISLLRAPWLYFYLWDHHERMSPERGYKTFLQLWGLYSLIK